MDSVPAFIYPPTDEELRRQLQAMIRQFELKRAKEEKSRGAASQSATYLSRMDYRQIVYKIGVLRAILDPATNGPVLSIQLAENLRRQHGGSLDTNDFISACRDVTDYLKQAQSQTHLRLVASPA